MNYTEKATRISDETDRSATTFEDWAEQFRNSLNEREVSAGQHAAIEREGEKKYNKLFYIVMVLAGVTVVALSLMKML